MTLATGDGGNSAAETSVVRRGDPPAEGSPLIVAKRMGVEATWGPIFGPVDLTVRRGGVTVLAAPGGRGRTALLLTLAGRMKPSSGELTGFGRTNDSHALFRQSAVALVDEVDEIRQAIRVRDIVTEQLRWAAPWYRWVKQSRAADLERLCRPVFGEYSIPAMEAYVEELPELSAALFRIAVANVHRPPLLVVGGIDQLSSVLASYKLLDRLAALGAHQTIITADINRGYGREGIRDVIDTPNVLAREFVTLEEEALS